MRIRIAPPPDAEPEEEVQTLPLPQVAPAGTVPVSEASGPSLRARAAGFFHARGVPAEALGAVALMFGGGAALTFFADHCGMAAALGMVALALGDLSLVPTANDALARNARAHLLLPLTDLLMIAGLVAGVAERHAPVVVLLALLVLVLTAWLPYLRSMAAVRGMPPVEALWGRTERLGIVLLGALTGRLAPALLAVTLVGALEAWSRAQRLESPPGLAPVDQWLETRHIRNPDGSMNPAVRWGSLTLIVVALVLLPQSNAWRF